MLTPDAIHSRPHLRGDDPIAAAEEEIRRYLFAHRIVPVAVATGKKGNPWIVLLGIYAILAVITGLGALWLNRVECDPMVMDRGFTSSCRDWSRDITKITGSSTGASISVVQPDSL
jgi:LPXTG-motif cell wall-anchored protein